MRALLFVLATLTIAAATIAPAEAQNYPWCAYYGGSRGGGGENCGFSTFAQCMADVSGIGGFCDRNTQYRGPHLRYRHR
ncbi:MAG: DUF3551 domain-containing protein [Xanthobacteraceae bacterium]